MEMPNRRGQPYISVFTAVNDTALESVDNLPIHKSKSVKQLTDLSQEFSSTTERLTKSQETDIHRVVSTTQRDPLDIEYEKQLKELREQLDLLPFKKKYSSITVPISVKYSTMAVRPKSPKKNVNVLEQQLDQDKMQAGLDETLYRIREQLNNLSVERVSMEKQMEELTNGIDKARLQCHTQCRRGASNNTVKRARSSASPRISQRKVLQSSPTSPKSIPSLQGCHTRSFSSSLGSPEPRHVSPDFSDERHRSVSVSSDTTNYTSYGSLGRRSKSNELRIRALSVSSNTSLSQGSDTLGNDWLSNPTIPELPESPGITKNPPKSNLTTRIRSNPTLHYAANTAPRSRRSYSTSTTSPPPITITSSPDISKPVTSRKSEKQCHPPSHRNSLPESVMNKIMEDEVDTVSVCDSLSQASLYQVSSSIEEGSPKSQGSTVIMRRSSLTGQVEHIRRPRYIVKRNSFNSTSDSLKESGPKSGSYSSLNTIRPEFRVLNTGFRRNRRNKIILPNSIETTV